LLITKRGCQNISGSLFFSSKFPFFGQPFGLPVFIITGRGMSLIRKSGDKSEMTGISSPGVLYDRYAPVLLGLCKRYCGNIEDAEDVLHDGFIKVLQNLSKFTPRGNGSFEGWMKRIMVNTALNHLRNKSKEKNLFSLVAPGNETLTENSGDDHQFFTEISGKVSKEELMLMICSLPNGYRTVFNLYVFESYSHKEIAETLGCTENTSKSQLSKARAMLRKQLNRIVVQITEQR
jgi:RNA polymerase sigma-70 factor (ECF subfamily)